MSRSTSRALDLDPQNFIDWIEDLVKKGKISDEVTIRRAISAIYFALFNYWAGKRYDMGMRARGPLKDRFKYSQFHSELLSKGLDAEVVLLYIYRVAADHYLLNPTRIEIFNKALRIKFGYIFQCKITLGILTKIIQATRNILAQI